MNFLSAVFGVGGEPHAVGSPSRGQSPPGTGGTVALPGIGSLVPEPDPAFDRIRLGSRVADLLPAGIRQILASTGDDPELVGRVAANVERAHDIQARLQALGIGLPGAAAGGSGADSGDPAGQPPVELASQLVGEQQQLTLAVADDLVSVARQRAASVRASLMQRYGGIAPEAALFSADASLAASPARSPQEARTAAVRIGLTLVDRVAKLDILKAEYDAAVLRGDTGRAEQIAGDYRAVYLQVRGVVEALETGQVQPSALQSQGTGPQPAHEFVAGRDGIDSAVDDVRTKPTDEKIEVTRDAIEEEATTGRSRILDEAIIGTIEQVLLTGNRMLARSFERMRDQMRESTAERKRADAKAAETQSRQDAANAKAAERKASFQQALEQARQERAAARQRFA